MRRIRIFCGQSRKAACGPVDGGAAVRNGESAGGKAFPAGFAVLFVSVCLPEIEGSLFFSPFSCKVTTTPVFTFPTNMITPETYSHIEEIKRRAGQLWRFL